MPLRVKACSTIGEAAAALGSDRAARYHGGGTLVMRAANEGDPGLGLIVRATDPALAEIRASGGRVILGAGVTMARILADRDLSFLHPAAQAIGGPAVRQAATVGGNLFAPAPYGDFAAALLALDATVAIATGHGSSREIAIEEFFAGRDRQAGLVASIAFARPASGAFRFRKVSRVRPKGISVLSIAAHLPGAGRGADLRIAYNAMARTPIRARAAERALAGRPLDAAGVAEAVRVAAEGTSPATDAIASEWYRREIVGVHLRRLLLDEAF